MGESKGKGGARKPYSKPEIKQVRLVLEEAVLATGCKTVSTTSGSGPTGIGCLARGCGGLNGT